MKSIRVDSLELLEGNEGQSMTLHREGTSKSRRWIIYSPSRIFRAERKALSYVLTI